MESFFRSFQLIKESFAVLRKDKEIMLFPVFSLIISSLVFISFVPVYLLIPPEGSNMYLFYALFFAYYIVSYFFIIFFNVGLIACAHIRLNGGDPTFGDGIRIAMEHLNQIIIWAIITGTVGFILKVISGRNSRGNFVAAILGMAWSLLTFLVIPIMIFENKGVIQSLSESGQLLKKTWGENIVARFSIDLFFFVLGLVGAIPFIILLTMSFSAEITISIIIVLFLMMFYFVVLGIISSSLKGIFVAALYDYTRTGKVPSAYDPETIKGAFEQKNR